jgi:MFS family permease
VIPPLATPLIERFGWRTALILVSGLIWFVLAPLILLLVRTRPVAAENNFETEQQIAAGKGFTFGEAIRTPVFWIFAFGAALIFYPIFVTSQQLILQAAKIGFTAWQSTFVLSGLFAVSVAGKFLFGFLSDRFDPYRVILLCVSIMFVSTFLLLDLNEITAFIFLVPFGLGYGGAFVLIQRLVADMFGQRDYPKILGVITIGDTIGAVVGGLITGKLADMFDGDYSVGFYGVILATGIALILMAILNLVSRDRITA